MVDLVSLDFGVTYQGMVTDAAVSMIAGNKAASSTRNLITDTQRSLMKAISVVRAGVRVGDISFAAQSVLEGKYGIVRDLVGHGVGHQLHEDPNIPNYGKKGTGPTLFAGMTIAIEPMATLGDHRIKTDADGWTIRTYDGSLSAHFEHTILITHDSVEILTTL